MLGRAEPKTRTGALEETESRLTIPVENTTYCDPKVNE